MLGQHRAHANFSVDDLGAARAFYVDKLGFGLEKEDENAILLRDGAGAHVVVYLKPDHRPWDSTVLGVEVDDVKAAVDELTASGVQIEKLDGTDEDGIMHIPQMGEAAWFKDPAGNWICVDHMT
jgi:catechol 2,3-dioxygenase-like lactoylglutathione lyase family enzyme